jgi:hypothetical protein
LFCFQANRQVARKSASKGPLPNEVLHFKQFCQKRRKSEMVSAVGTDYLQRLDFKSSETPFIAISVFENLFSDFKSSFDCSKLMQIFGEKVRQNFLFDNWCVSHVSMVAASTILTFMGKVPPMLFSSTNQLSKFPTVRLPALSTDLLPDEMFSVSPESNLSSRSRRTKLLTEKFQNSTFLTNGRLMASFSSPNNSVEEIVEASDSVQKIDESVVVTKARIRPKYRHLVNLADLSSSLKIRPSLPKGWKVEENPEFEEIVSPTGDRLKTCRRKSSNIFESTESVGSSPSVIFESEEEVRQVSSFLTISMLISYKLKLFLWA